MSNLAEAAQAVIERWDCPLWDWEMEGPTADLIHALRLALAAHEAAKPAEPTAFMGVNPRTGTLEFCAHQPSPSVMRDFDMKPLYAAPVAVAEWMPIETAPKDGEVLIYVTETDEQFVAYWDEGWRFSRNAKLKSPTHWQPLPPAPEMKP